MILASIRQLAEDIRIFFFRIRLRSAVRLAPIKERGDADGRVPDSAHLDECQGALAGRKSAAGPRTNEE